MVRKTRKALVLVAAIGVLLAAFATPASAATGGGCTTVSASHSHICISWVTGKGMEPNYFLDAFNPVQSTGFSEVFITWCLTGQACNTRLLWRDNTNHLGLYPNRVPFQPGTSTHGDGWTVVNFYKSNGAYEGGGLSPAQHW
jgi:hypothetical protein